MDSLVVSKLNEALVKVECERNLAQELSDYFTFFVPGYQFMPTYKNRLWDGKMRLFDLRNNTIYYGLVPYIQKFCEERKYKCIVESNVNTTENYSLVEAQQFIETLKLPFEVRDYQLNSFVHAIRNRRILLLSPTSSGKSLIIYLIMRLLQDAGLKKGILIVPTTSLVEQMYADFESYGFDSEKYCHRQYAGKEKITDKFLTITTWQSIYNNPKSYFEPYDFVVGDEAHQFKAKSFVGIMTALENAKYRIGCTGTLDGAQTHKLVLEGLFGPVYQSITTKEMIDKNYASKFDIKCLILKYSEEVCKKAKSFDYQGEIDYIIKSDARNVFIKNLTLSLKGNSLVLFNRIDHGREIFRLINEDKAKKKRKIFFVYGGTDVEVRESIRSITEKENDAIIVASYGTFSTGINIRNLHNVIFASPSKSRVRNLQSIGRGLRLGDNKYKATLYDIADDFRVGKFVNFTIKHFIERIKIYDGEKFEYKFYNIELKNG